MDDVKSVRSDERSFIRFINTTARDVDIIWINFTGQFVRYEILKSSNYIDVNTFKTHPWIALDSKTRDRLHIDKNFVYNPKTTKEFFQEKYPNKNIPEDFETRIRVYITLPLYSLRYRSLLEVRNYFRNTEEIDALDLPKELSDDLKRSIDLRNNQIIMPLIRI